MYPKPRLANFTGVMALTMLLSTCKRSTGALKQQSQQKLVVVWIVRQISKIYGRGGLKSVKKLIFDPILWYHTIGEEGYLPWIRAVEFHDHGERHCVETTSVKFVYILVLRL
jgi:hypothetical protein